MPNQTAKLFYNGRSQGFAHFTSGPGGYYLQ
jgi:hypothetical protein